MRRVENVGDGLWIVDVGWGVIGLGWCSGFSWVGIQGRCCQRLPPRGLERELILVTMGGARGGRSAVFCGLSDNA